MNVIKLVIFAAAVSQLALSAFGQRPQDNWYLEQTWTKSGGNLVATNGGLSSPYGVAIGPSGRIYVGDQGYGRIQVYLPDGSFSFSITNGFGGGQSFSQPRGMITDGMGFLYVADAGLNCVFVFTGDGVYQRKIGGTNGSGNGQLAGVVDVAVARNGDVFILESSNHRVSVFDANGNFLRNWGGLGTLTGQLYNPASIAISPSDIVYVAQAGSWSSESTTAAVKAFQTNGLYVTTVVGPFTRSCSWFVPYSVRVDASGLIHTHTVFLGTWDGLCTQPSYTMYWQIDTLDAGRVAAYDVDAGTSNNQNFKNAAPFHALGPDGSMVVCCRLTQQLMVYRRVLREQWAPPRNWLPMPAVTRQMQRANSPLVDIDYQVTDADDTNVFVGVLVFTNSSSTPALGNCLRQPNFVEGTSTNLGPGITANQPHRLTWNAGSDWNINLGNYRVAVLARDSRTNLLDVHYLTLPAERGMPTLKISRSPLIQNDFMQVWWWLLATNDTGVTLSSNRIYGTTGAYTAKVLCDNGSSTVDGRAYLYEKMNVREATAQEVQWAKQATMPAGTSPNQWGPGRSINGRPSYVNEYGFDTGNWDTNICKWVVPLN